MTRTIKQACMQLCIWGGGGGQSREMSSTCCDALMRGQARVASRGWGRPELVRAFRAGPTAAASARLPTWKAPPSSCAALDSYMPHNGHYSAVHTLQKICSDTGVFCPGSRILICLHSCKTRAVHNFPCPQGCCLTLFVYKQHG